MAAYFVSPCSFLSFGQDSWAGSPPGLPGFGGGPLPLFFSSGVGPAVWVRGRPPWHSRGALSARATLNSKAFGPYHNRLSLRARF